MIWTEVTVCTTQFQIPNYNYYVSELFQIIFYFQQHKKALTWFSLDKEWFFAQHKNRDTEKNYILITLSAFMDWCRLTVSAP
jgi:hypothetical protein